MQLFNLFSVIALSFIFQATSKQGQKEVRLLKKVWGISVYINVRLKSFSKNISS